MNVAARRGLGYVAGVLALTAAWELLALALHTPALPPPAVAIAAFWRALSAGLLREFAASAWRVVAAMAIGTALAAPLGLLLGRSPRTDAIAAPIVYLTYPVPKVVFLPVLLVLLGIGDFAKITLITIIVFFQILVTTRDAARAVSPQAILSARSLGATGAQVFRHVVIPATLPDTFTALRIGTGTAVAVLFLAESIAGSSGLGFYIVDAWGRIDYGSMFAGIIALALLGVGLYEILEAVERRVCRWTRVGQ